MVIKMSYLPSEGYKRVAVLFMYAVIAFLAFRYLLPLILPFVIAWFIALALRPLAGLFSRAAKIPYKPAAVILLTAVLCVVGFGIYMAAGRVAGELEGLGSYVSGWIEAASNGITGAVERISHIIPIPELFNGSENPANITSGADTDTTSGTDTNMAAGMAAGMATDLIMRVTGELAAGLSSKLPNALSALPGGLFFTVITVVSAFYITADFDNINRRLTDILPAPASLWLKRRAVKLKGAGLSYLRACLYLMCITFVELFCGFLILKIDYAFTIALLCAAADLLPVIGVGTILAPWALVLIIGGSYYQGVGLLIVWGVTAIVRQVLEPKIVGQSIGLNPLATLIAMYAGYKCAGILGMVCAPIAAILLK